MTEVYNLEHKNNCKNPTCYCWFLPDHSILNGCFVKANDHVGDVDGIMDANGGYMLFIEWKQPGQAVKHGQALQHSMLKALGHHPDDVSVLVVWGYNDFHRRTIPTGFTWVQYGDRLLKPEYECNEEQLREQVAGWCARVSALPRKPYINLVERYTETKPYPGLTVPAPLPLVA